MCKNQETLSSFSDERFLFSFTCVYTQLRLSESPLWILFQQSLHSFCPSYYECSAAALPDGGDSHLQAWTGPLSSTRGRYHTNLRHGGCLQADKEKSAAWADLLAHKYQRLMSKAVCDLGGSAAAILIYRCGPAALVMAAAVGACTPNRLICCQTTSSTFDVAWCLLQRCPCPTILTRSYKMEHNYFRWQRKHVSLWQFICREKPS